MPRTMVDDEQRVLSFRLESRVAGHGVGEPEKLVPSWVARGVSTSGAIAESLVAAGLSVVLAACTTPGRPIADAGPPSAYQGIDAIRTDAEGFEIPPVLSPEQALPAQLRRGDHFQVVGDVTTDGFTSTYTLSSDFGEFEIHGTDLLRMRIHEIEVLAALQEHQVSNEKVYALAVANAAEGPIEGAAQLIVHPVDTITGIPKGVWSYVQRILEMTRGERTYLEDSYGGELVGYGKAKREWGYRLGVDVYSRNKRLQEELNRYAGYAFAGGMTVRLPLMVVPGLAGTLVGVTGTADDMKRELRDKSPEGIRLADRNKLEAMGISGELARKLVGHPWYSPTEQLIIVTALGELQDARNRGEFLRVAVLADDEDETFFYARMALLLAAYDNNVAPIRELIAPNGLIVALTAGNDAVVPVYVDFPVWCERAQAFLDAVEQSLPANRRFNRKIFWLSGTVSPRLEEEAAKRGWKIDDGISERYLVEFDEAMWRPGEPAEDRVLPEIGS